MNLFCTLVLLLAGASEPRSVELYKRDVPKTSGTGSFISAIYTDLSHLRPEAKDKRMPRGTKDARAAPRGQESPSSYSYPVHHEPSDYFITPKTAKLYNTTVNLDGDRGEVRQGTKGAGNGSSTEKAKPNIHNSLYPVTDSSYSAYAVMFLSLIVFAVGVVGNLAVMCIVWHNYYMKSAWNCILASLAFWDFLVLFLCLPVVIFKEITKKRLLGDISCRAVPYLEVTSLGVTTFSLCALVIDRFHAATSIRPKPQPVEPCSSILAKLGVVWIGSMILAIPELLLWQLSREDYSVAPGGTADACYMKPSPSLPESVYSLMLTYHNARTWWFFGCYLCLPVLFTVSCQLVTHRIVAGAGRRQEGRLPPVSPKQKHHQGLRGQRLDTTVVALTVVYTLCTLPGNISSIALASSSTQVSAPTLALLALMNQLFLFSKSSMTPVLLLCLCRALGQSFMHCCCCCCEECLLNGSSSSSPSTPSSASNPITSTGTPSPVFFNNTRNSSSILVIGTPC